MSRRPSLIYAVCLRFDGLKAIGVSRHAEKRRLRHDAIGRGLVLPPLALSTGRIHSDKTLETYKGYALRYAQWARATYGVRRLADLDREAERLVSLYLAARLEASDSPSTLKTIRAALRMLHRPAYPAPEREERVRTLGADVPLPLRRREEITRSRKAVVMDQGIVLTRYTEIIDFCLATGVRRRELCRLVAGDVSPAEGGGLVVAVANGKGGKHRSVPVLPGHEESVRRVIADRVPGDRLFPRVPARLDVHSYRRTYAQALYCEDGQRRLPPPLGRLVPGSIDQDRARYVSSALGHDGRVDVLVRHYLR